MVTAVVSAGAFADIFIGNTRVRPGLLRLVSQLPIPAFAVVVAPAFLLTAFLPAAAVFMAAVFRAALIAAQRFLVAAMMARRPSAESLRFALGACVWRGVARSDSPRMLAHLFRVASPMRLRAAALILRRFRTGTSDGVARGAEPPFSMARSSAISESICCFCCLNPAIAAFMISGVSFDIAMAGPL